MGCYMSSPHARRNYRDPADLDEIYIPEDALPLRTFGQYRNSSVVIPDDIDGLPSPHRWNQEDHRRLATDPNLLLYQAEIDNGKAWRFYRICLAPCLLPYIVTRGATYLLNCDEICCWVRKEYNTRTYYRVYPNRIEVNNPGCRFWGYCGCGSWNADKVLAHPFDRGAFGFRRIPCGDGNLCFAWPVFGDTVARQRCQCNGPFWGSGCSEWWCEEWMCGICCCSYRYTGLANGDEVAFASSLALQAYFENRTLTQQEFDQCLQYWRDNISEEGDPVGRKRPVCCEPYLRIPCFTCWMHYSNICQYERRPAFLSDGTATEEQQHAFAEYDAARKRQIKRYNTFKAPARLSTLCQCGGCRRFFGRKGCIFCTEGCYDEATGGCSYRNLDIPKGMAPPFAQPDIDDDNDASKVLQIVLGGPPMNVSYKRWERNAGTGQLEVVVFPSTRQRKEKPSVEGEAVEVKHGDANEEVKES